MHPMHIDLLVIQSYNRSTIGKHILFYEEEFQMKRVVLVLLCACLTVVLCTATAEAREHHYHLCHHECGYCHADLLNVDEDQLFGPEAAIVAKMYTRPMVTFLDAKYVGICLYDTDVFFRPNDVKVGQIHECDDVYVLETGKYWYKIVFQDEFIGYVRSKAVELYDANIPYDTQLYIVTSTGGNRHAFVRDCPCGDSEIVGRLNRGDFLKIVEFYNNNWAYVVYNSEGSQGFIMTDLIKISHKFDR